MPNAANPPTADARFLSHVLGAICLYVPALITIQMLVREHQTTWADAFGFRKEAGCAVRLALLATIVLLPVIMLLLGGISMLLESLHHAPVSQDIVKVVQESTGFSHQLVFGIVTIGLAPIVEELWFRGVIYPSVKGLGFPRLAWWGTSLFFGLVHGNLAAFVPLTLLSMALIWLYERSQNLLTPMLAHAVFNAVNFYYLINGGKTT